MGFEPTYEGLAESYPALIPASFTAPGQSVLHLFENLTPSLSHRAHQALVIAPLGQTWDIPGMLFP